MVSGSGWPGAESACSDLTDGITTTTDYQLLRLLTHPIIKEFEGADWGIRKPRSNQLCLLSFVAGAMIAQFLAEGPI